MIQNFKSTKTIISKVFRDLGIQDTDWIHDSIEWMGEALQAIGSVTQLEKNVEVLKTSSHKAPLPSNLYLINQVRYGYFNSNETEEPKLEDFSRVMPYESSGLHPSLIDEYNTMKGVSWSDETFFIQDGFIHTSFEEDWIALVYKAISVDDDGFPKVPDHFSFNQALYWYIVMKLMESGQKHPAGLNYFHAEERWLKYCTQARTKALMPDEAKYEEFLRSWVNIIPNYDADFNNKVSEESNIGRNGMYIIDEGDLTRY